MPGFAVRVSAALLATTLAACTSAPTTPAAPAAEARIDMAPDGPAWEVGYTLPHPVTALRFARVDHAGTRARDWRPLDSALEIAVTPEGEVVRRRDGGAFTRARFAMDPRYVQLEKDYAPFSPFGDGGLLIHTGRLHACAERCDDEGEHRWRVRITPPADAHLIHAGETAATADFLDEQPGTNVYVGHARPVATRDVMAVVDPTLPPGIRDRLDTLLPRLMDLYGDEFGRLPSRPMLYVSRDERHPGGGYGYQGGTLPGQVFMHVYGRHPAFASAGFARRMDSFFAHEAVHLYQHYPELAEQGDSWIHEGGADALALLALARLGEIDADTVRRRVDAAVASCGKGIAEAPLLPLPATGRFDLTYACGLAVQMAVDAAGGRADRPCDLFCVWREFQQRVDAGAPWSTATFTQVVADRVGPETARFVRDAVTTSPADPAAFFASVLPPRTDG